VALDDGSYAPNLYSGYSTTVMGWGAVKASSFPPVYSAILLEAGVLYVNRSTCSADYLRAPAPKLVTGVMLCAAKDSTDSCQGDSGGPLILKSEDGSGNDVQIGVVSWGLGCADQRYPGVYAEVAAVREWIDGTLQSWGALPARSCQAGGR
jgi:trypsin